MLKYIVILDKDNVEHIFLFSAKLTHSDVREGIGATPVGSYESSGKNWERMRGACIAAGFWSKEHGCYGRSESLNKDSRGKVDDALI